MPKNIHPLMNYESKILKHIKFFKLFNGKVIYFLMLLAHLEKSYYTK